ncbi:MAG: hypothetical protein AAB386_02420 [Patescibacteria group bacterium]
MKEKPTDEKAMEGRLIKDGVDLGDKHFHEVGWGTTPDKAHEDLERMAGAEVELAEQQAEAFAQKDKEIGISAYKGLVEIYKNHPNVEKWKKRIEELKRD